MARRRRTIRGYFGRRHHVQRERRKVTGAARRASMRKPWFLRRTFVGRRRFLV